MATSPSEVGNGSPPKGAATPPPLEVGKEVGDGWGIIPGMLFLVLRRCTWGVAQIYIGCVGFMDFGWSGRGDSLSKRSTSFCNSLESSSSVVVCRPVWARV